MLANAVTSHKGQMAVSEDAFVQKEKSSPLEFLGERERWEKNNKVSVSEIVKPDMSIPKQ